MAKPADEILAEFAGAEWDKRIARHYRVIEARQMPVNLQPGRIAVRWIDISVDSNGKTDEQPLPDDMSVFQRINQLAILGWRLAHITPTAFWLEQ